MQCFELPGLAHGSVRETLTGAPDRLGDSELGDSEDVSQAGDPADLCELAFLLLREGNLRIVRAVLTTAGDRRLSPSGVQAGYCIRHGGGYWDHFAHAGQLQYLGDLSARGCQCQ
jgi:hypothetical protein